MASESLNEKGIRVFFRNSPSAIVFVGSPRELVKLPHPKCMRCTKDWDSCSYDTLSDKTKKEYSVDEREALLIITL